VQGNPYGPGAPRLEDAGMPAAAALAGIGAARFALTATGDDCITETPTSWQADCAFEGYTLIGQATKSGDTWTFDVTMTYTAQNSMVITWSGEVTSNEAVLQGRVTARWTYSDGTSSLQWDWDSGFDLALADGCPVGGSAESTWTWRPQSGQGAGSVYQLDVSAEFGPTCGDVRFY